MKEEKGKRFKKGSNSGIVGDITILSSITSLL